MRRTLSAVLLACALAIVVARVADVILPDICNVIPWWPGCEKDSGGGGGGGAG